ncbi:PREDICTED: uncharacterized protein LOC107357954 [Acropora digitifera]|uniref:uncharacterized protein LOC107357954 n=1 Tax=Acropora digitifera TaxID=70779 RepID=UPI00077A21AB|nr:PREDICTED: uncharacterized protein LOC107357954 [Acropora digitifera]
MADENSVLWLLSSLIACLQFNLALFNLLSTQYKRRDALLRYRGLLERDCVIHDGASVSEETKTPLSMGGNESKSHSKRKETTSTGFMGRGRHTEYYTNILVKEINGCTVGKEIIKRCGNEGHHPHLRSEDKATLRFLRAANSFIPDAENDGADMKNAAFILRQPGREFVLKSGNGDWEYDFCEDSDGQIYGRCIRKPLLSFVYDKTTSTVVRLVKFLIPYVPWGGLKALTER